MSQTPADAERVASEPDVLTSSPRSVTALVESPIGDPAPLGLAGFAMTTVLLSLVNAGVIGGSAVNAVLPLALCYGGGAQLLAGMWEFRNRNTFGGLAFSSYGAFWISFYVLIRWWAPSTAGATNDALGFFLLMWGIFTLYMFIASFGTNVAVMLVFFSLTVTFFVLAASYFGGQTGGYFQVKEVAGYCGLVTGALAWYTSFAGVLNATWKRVVLPVGPLTRTAPLPATRRAAA
ncbi:MAG: acetate uptake transporter [Actinomycetota bacterium]|nr:acetate uptake transporter [Actinomycetota bacterium]